MRSVLDATSIQSVKITLSDGRELIYSGPVQVSVDEVSKGEVRIRSVIFSPPRKMPDGAHFEDIQPQSLEEP